MNVISDKKIKKIKSEYPYSIRYQLESISQDFCDFISERYGGEGFTEKLYRHVYGVNICNYPDCENETTYRTWKKGFDDYCSQKCGGKDKSDQIVKKGQKTKKERYGDSGYNNTEKIKETQRQKYGGMGFESDELSRRAKKTTEKRHGDKNYRNTDKAKQTKKKRYGNENYVNVEKAKKTKKQKYGNEYYVNIEKIKETNRKKYGEDWFFQTDEFKKKFKETMKEKYDVEHHFKKQEFVEKRRKTNKERYGVETPLNNKKILEKSRKGCLEKFGEDNYRKTEKGREEASKQAKKTGFGSEQFKEWLNEKNVDNTSQLQSVRKRVKKTRHRKKYQRLFENRSFSEKIEPLFDFSDYDGVGQYKEYSFRCKKCDEEFEDYLNNGNVPRCPKCYSGWNHVGESEKEKEVLNYINDLLSSEICIVENDTTVLGGKELDVYIPEKNVAVEFNGMYWHSEKSGEKKKNYHLNKTKICEEKDIQLIHIFESEWDDQKNVVKKRIKNVMGDLPNETLNFQKYKIKEVSENIEKNFLNDNHLMGTTNSTLVLGLFNENEDLISIISFLKCQEYWEIKQFCSLGNFDDAFKELFQYFVQNYTVDTVVSYLERRWDSSFYEKFGFEKVETLDPKCYYFKKDSRLNIGRNFSRKKVKENIEDFDEDLTEWQNMQLLGYDRVWDCGHLKYKWSKK